MTHLARTERIKALVDSLERDDAERDWLKIRADDALARFRDAVREFAGESDPGPARAVRSGERPTAG